MTEIERKYLARLSDADVLDDAEASRIRQGYLTDREPAVRIRERVQGDKREYTLTVKAGRGLVRREVEVLVDEDSAHALIEMAGRHVIEKTRYRVGRWDVDVFAGSLTGLILAEIELEHVREHVDTPSGIELVREVTDDASFTNQRLAFLSSAEAAALARWVGRG